MTKILNKIVLGAAAMTMLVACNSNPEWKVKGTIEGAANELIVLEASNNGRWYPLDTLSADKSGRFEFKQPAAGYPDIYRLTAGDKTIYFPVDSIETVTINATAGSVEIKGTQSADAIMRVDKLVNDAVAQSGTAAFTDPELKRRLAEIILENPSGIAAYYAINKKVGDNQLYNPANKNDLRIIGAVANSFDMLRPHDPRTAYLKSIFLSNRNQNVPGVTLEASEISYIDISLLDQNGKRVNLSDLVNNGKVTLLSFTALTADQSPAYNLELGKIYTDLSPRGLQIYQIGFDNDEFAWRKSAKNLPWTSVYNGTNNAQTLMNYNVGALPALFILDRKGNIVERVDDITKLRGLVEKYL